MLAHYQAYCIIHNVHWTGDVEQLCRCHQNLGVLTEGGPRFTTGKVWKHLFIFKFEIKEIMWRSTAIYKVSEIERFMSEVTKRTRILKVVASNSEQEP